MDRRVDYRSARVASWPVSRRGLVSVDLKGPAWQSRHPPMQVNVQKLSPVLVEFDVEIAGDRVQNEVDKAYQSLAKSARISGFRKGKAPRQVLTRLFGARVAQDVAKRLIDESFPKAVAEQKLQPLNDPAIEPADLKQGAAFSYKARFEVVPDIETVEYEALEAKRIGAEVTDELLDGELEKLRQAYSTLEPPKDARGAQAKDHVSVDLKVSVGGKEVRDAGGEDVQLELGSSNLFAEIEAALAGKRVGEEVETTVAMPPSHPHKQLAGQQALFQFVIKDIKERVLPELDDEFAKDVDEAFEKLDDLKDKLREQLKVRLEEEAENHLAQQLVNDLCKKNPIPVPPSLVQRQAELTEREVLMDARRRGQTGQIGAELRSMIASESEAKVRAGLLIAAIARLESITIGEPELEEGLKELAEQTGKNIAKLRAEYRDAQRREILIGMVLENKVLDLIESKAKLEDA